MDPHSVILLPSLLITRCSASLSSFFERSIKLRPLQCSGFAFLPQEPLDVRFDSRHVVHDELAMHGRLRRVQSISASVKVTPGSADIERTPASTSSTSGTGKRPARHFMMAASTEMSEAAPDFSIDCTPSSRVTRKTVAPCCTTTMLVGAARASAPSAVIIRNRWPSGETSYVPCLAGARARR